VHGCLHQVCAPAWFLRGGLWTWTSLGGTASSRGQPSKLQQTLDVRYATHHGVSMLRTPNPLRFGPIWRALDPPPQPTDAPEKRFARGVIGRQAPLPPPERTLLANRSLRCREEGVVDELWEQYVQVCALGGLGGPLGYASCWNALRPFLGAHAGTHGYCLEHGIHTPRASPSRCVRTPPHPCLHLPTPGAPSM